MISLKKYIWSRLTFAARFRQKRIARVMQAALLGFATAVHPGDLHTHAEIQLSPSSVSTATTAASGMSAVSGITSYWSV